MTSSAPRPVWTLPVPTIEGAFLASYSDLGLSGLEFPSNDKSVAGSFAASEAPNQIHRWHQTTTSALARALAGQPAGELPPLDLSCGTDFQQRVWQALRSIALGRTWTYGDVACAIARPKATRAVGAACGANPIPVLVPCHRVLAAGGRIGGFSSGLRWKRLLLEREAIVIR